MHLQLGFECTAIHLQALLARGTALLLAAALALQLTACSTTAGPTRRAATR